MTREDDTDLDSLVRWPTDADGWPHTALVGALLVATIPLVVPGVLLAGYAVRVLRAGPDDPLPGFTDLRSLVATGVRSATVVVAYHLPVALLAVVGLGASVTALVHGVSPAPLRPTSLATLGSSVALTGLVTVTVAVTLPLCGYLATIAVTTYATTDDVAAAFDPHRIRDRAWSKATLRAWLLGSLVAMATGVVAFLAGAVATATPGVGGLLVGVVWFYGGTVALRIWRVRRPANERAAASAEETNRTRGSADADPA